MATTGRGFRAELAAASRSRPLSSHVSFSLQGPAARPRMPCSSARGSRRRASTRPASKVPRSTHPATSTLSIFNRAAVSAWLAAGASQSQLFTSLPADSIGNGIRFDRQGRMYVADFRKHNVWVIERGETTPRVYFHSDRFNQPNDLAIAADGTLYASDPRFASPAGGQIWRITRGADGKGQGEVMSSTRRLGVTNGIDLSPDGATLYVSEFEFAAGLGLSPRRQQAARPAAGQEFRGFRGRWPAHRRRWPDLSRAAFGRQDRHYRGQWIART